MSKRKGLSFEEKREKMLEIFTESAECFTLKELEKIGPKRKGIISQSVKEVVESLRDDDMVLSDKCGVQTLFWCFPSDAVQKKRARLQKICHEVNSAAADVERLQSERLALEDGREESEERDQLVREVTLLEEEAEALRKKKAAFAELDPELMDEIRKATTCALEATNRWTDNVFSVKSWVEGKFGISSQDFFQQFQIPSDLDYLEIKQ